MRNPSLFDFGCKQWSEAVPAEVDRFVVNIDTTFVKQVFDIVECKRKTNVRHDSQPDDFR